MQRRVGCANTRNGEIRKRGPGAVGLGDLLEPGATLNVPDGDFGRPALGGQAGPFKRTYGYDRGLAHKFQKIAEHRAGAQFDQ